MPLGRVSSLSWSSTLHYMLSLELCMGNPCHRRHFYMGLTEKPLPALLSTWGGWVVVKKIVPDNPFPFFQASKYSIPRKREEHCTSGKCCPEQGASENNCYSPVLSKLLWDSSPGPNLTLPCYMISAKKWVVLLNVVCIGTPHMEATAYVSSSRDLASGDLVRVVWWLGPLFTQLRGLPNSSDKGSA